MNVPNMKVESHCYEIWQSKIQITFNENYGVRLDDQFFIYGYFDGSLGIPKFIDILSDASLIGCFLHTISIHE